MRAACPSVSRAHVGGIDALTAVSRYAGLLYIYRSTATHTTLDVIAGAVKDVLVEHGVAPLVVIDYLQKVCTPDHLGEEEKVTRITEGLKDLSIEFECPVLAISASDRAGLEPGTRMRARNMRGSTALAYEADVVLIMSNKADVVARHHLMYGANNGEHFKEWSVVTIEKNRSGYSGGEVEFRKHLDCGRFDANGQVVSEKLVDERVYTESAVSPPSGDVRTCPMRDAASADVGASTDRQPRPSRTRYNCDVGREASCDSSKRAWSRQPYSSSCAGLTKGGASDIVRELRSGHAPASTSNSHVAGPPAVVLVASGLLPKALEPSPAP